MSDRGRHRFGEKNKPIKNEWMTFADYLKIKNENIDGGNLAYNLQLSSGHWGARDHNGNIFVTEEKFGKGQTPERFKYESYRIATPEEKREYEILYAKHIKDIEDNAPDPNYSH